jgi:3-deoxy-manno-octulosonate cytidylyltransferase (CMP-KDO synthetase)
MQESTTANPNCVKLVCDNRGRALYFSRSPVPHVRDERPNFAGRPSPFLQHLGVYAYRKTVLLQLAQLPPSPLEELERLEQLRALSNGIGIQVGLVTQSGRGVDTFDDYQRFVQEYSGLKIRLRRAA